MICSTSAVSSSIADPDFACGGVVLVLLGLGELAEVLVLDPLGVALDQRGERAARGRLRGQRRGPHLVEPEVLVLQHVRELVRERRLPFDVERTGAPHDDLLLVGVVEADDGRLVRGVERLDQVGPRLDEPERAQRTRELAHLPSRVGAQPTRLHAHPLAGTPRR